jgi:hypothetical protein
LEPEHWRHCTSFQPLKADSKWKNIFESRHSRTKTIFEDSEKTLQKSWIYIFFSPLSRGENGICDRSAEENLTNPKIARDPYFLGLCLAIYNKNVSIHLVTQSF